MTKHFQEYTEGQQEAFATVFAGLIKAKHVDTVKRCMSLANVNITMGAPDQTDDQFRIEKDNQAEVLTLLLKEYL